MSAGDKEAILDGVPEGATLAMAREQVIPARTWVDTGLDGIEMYLDAGEDARLLLRKVAKPEPESCAEPVWDGPYKMSCGRQLAGGKCGRHG